MGWGSAAFAQQIPASPLAKSQPLPTRADTVAALHQLFQTKRKSSGVVLAAAPVTLLLTVATVGLFAVSQVDNGASESAFPVVVIAGGLGATSALLSRYIRYTKGREAAIVSKYERTHVLAGWVKRNLARQKPLTQ
ncbi:hypothetical protein KB206_14580 [Microvirga sp. STS02]|uniref:hypothetical protein n=1 Tax=Hymenobacter negativus TaxID=2795026 RepID=UPI0018DBFE96|nr:MULTISPECIES: hypothetical protein [Bacteria]MBH8570113.1 hypothetical protein [Hymenobacter negativus]MBR7209853.1 hypothetical protein [Microvirga sp. STS02]